MSLKQTKKDAHIQLMLAHKLITEAEKSGKVDIVQQELDNAMVSLMSAIVVECDRSDVDITYDDWQRIEGGALLDTNEYYTFLNKSRGFISKEN